MKRLAKEGILPGVPVLPPTGCLTLSKLLKFSVPEFPDL